MKKEYKLLLPLEVMNKDAGKFEKTDTVIVEFKGLQGNRALRKLQDKIFQAFKDSGSKDSESKSSKDTKNLTEKDIRVMLEVTGNSESMFTGVMRMLEDFATINGNKLSEDIQGQMQSEDFDGLFDMVIEDFLSQKIISMMNSIKT